MTYFYDSHGWLSDAEIPGRATSIEPPAHGEKVVGQPYPNWTGIEWVMAPYSEAAAPSQTLAECKAQKITAIRAHFGAMVEALKVDAAPYEVETWPVQSAEYTAWMANPAALTPYVSALAAARSITVAELMAKIGVKVTGLATIQGTQHALETAVSAATTIEEVAAVFS